MPAKVLENILPTVIAGLAKLVDEQKKKLASGIVAVASASSEGKLGLVVGVTADLTARFSAVDLVLDCSDNFQTRHAINRACVQWQRPLVSGAGVRFDGQVSVFDSRREDSPCYECLFPEDATPEEVRCAVMGVFAPLTGIVGTLQAAEALKLIARAGTSLCGRLLIIDALGMDFRSVRVPRDPQCKVCAPPAKTAP